ncbi:MAG: dephospho-CoA kinase [Candidatus Zixiibacteriota bacterium]
MYTVGLTGQMACGKSTVARELQKLGAVVINADDLGKEVVATNATVLKRLKTAFGADNVFTNRKLNRTKLASKAFATEENTAKLNAIVHPALLALLRKQIARHSRSRRTKLLVVDAALLFDWKLDRELDVVIVVDSTLKNQLARLKKAGRSRQDAMQRIKRQIPKYRLRKMADAVICNNGTTDQLVQKTWRLYARLVQHSGQKFD